jgi:hypothetical protein
MEARKRPNVALKSGVGRSRELPLRAVVAWLLGVETRELNT